MCAFVYPGGSTSAQGQSQKVINSQGINSQGADGCATALGPSARDPSANGSAAEQSQYRPVDPAFAIAPAVSVVLPVKNEARNLPIVFNSLPDWISEVVLVDGQSVDDTVAVAQRCYPDVKIIHQMGTGKGDALLAGFAACTGDIIVMIDGDGSTDGAEIVRFVAALVGGADYAKGSRFSNSGASDDITVHRRVGNRILCALVNLSLGTHYTDLCYGYNAFWARHLSALRLDCRGFEVETLMNIRAAKAGLRVQEVPSHERLRVHGVSNLRVIFDGWRILRVIVAEAAPKRGRRSWSRRQDAAAEPARSVPAVAAGTEVSQDPGSVTSPKWEEAHYDQA